MALGDSDWLWRVHGRYSAWRWVSSAGRACLRAHSTGSSWRACPMRFAAARSSPSLRRLPSCVNRSGAAPARSTRSCCRRAMRPESRRAARSATSPLSGRAGRDRRVLPTRVAVRHRPAQPGRCRRSPVHLWRQQRHTGGFSGGHQVGAIAVCCRMRTSAAGIVRPRPTSPGVRGRGVTAAADHGCVESRGCARRTSQDAVQHVHAASLRAACRATCVGAAGTGGLPARDDRVHDRDNRERIVISVAHGVAQCDEAVHGIHGERHPREWWKLGRHRRTRAAASPRRGSKRVARGVTRHARRPG